MKYLKIHFNIKTMKRFKIILATGLFINTSLSLNAQLPKINKELSSKVPASLKNSNLTEEEVAKGIKEALNNGIEKGVNLLSVKDGYLKDLTVKIPLPNEAKQAEERLRKIGQSQLIDNTIESINRAAEGAANSSKELFVNAIKELTLQDVMTILNGEQNAATTYLSNHTREQLFLKFKPIIEASLNNVGATKYWETMITTYNKIPLVQKINPDLVDYATNKAIDGLFIKIEREEIDIRKNPEARTTDLLKKVFK